MAPATPMVGESDEPTYVQCSGARGRVPIRRGIELRYSAWCRRHQPACIEWPTGVPRPGPIVLWWSRRRSCGRSRSAGQALFGRRRSSPGTSSSSARPHRRGRGTGPAARGGWPASTVPSSANWPSWQWHWKCLSVRHPVVAAQARACSADRRRRSRRRPSSPATPTPAMVPLADRHGERDLGRACRARATSGSKSSVHGDRRARCRPRGARPARRRRRARSRRSAAGRAGAEAASRAGRRSSVRGGRAARVARAASPMGDSLARNDQPAAGALGLRRGHPGASSGSASTGRRSVRQRRRRPGSSARKSSGRLDRVSRRSVQARVVVMSTSRTTGQLERRTMSAASTAPPSSTTMTSGSRARRRRPPPATPMSTASTTTPGLGGEHASQPLTHQGMAVQDEHPHRVWRHDGLLEESRVAGLRPVTGMLGDRRASSNPSPGTPGRARACIRRDTPGTSRAPGAPRRRVRAQSRSASWFA